jgi:hypothetical protein
MTIVPVLLGFLANVLKLLLEFFQVLIRESFKIDKFVSRALNRSDYLIELQMNGFSVAILRVLNQEHHQEGNDGGAGIDDELSGIGVMKSRSSRAPNNDNETGNDERPCATQNARGFTSKNAKSILNRAQKSSGSFLFFEFLILSFSHNVILASHALSKMCTCRCRSFKKR